MNELDYLTDHDKMLITKIIMDRINGGKISRADKLQLIAIVDKLIGVDEKERNSK